MGADEQQVDQGWTHDEADKNTASSPSSPILGYF